MQDNSMHDHSAITHTAKCDQCDYIAKTHAHDDEEANMSLSIDLAAHNKDIHNTETNSDDIKESVRAKTHVAAAE